MSAAPTGPQSRKPVASKEEARRRINRIAYWSLPFMIAFGVWNLIPNLPDAWRFAVMPVEIVFVVVYGTAVIRFSLWQRDEYWRERGSHRRLRWSVAASDPPIPPCPAQSGNGACMYVGDGAAGG